MVILEMAVEVFWIVRGMTAVFADVHLRSSLLEAEVKLHSMHLATVRLEGTSLRERLLTECALVWSNTFQYNTQKDI